MKRAIAGLWMGFLVGAWVSSAAWASDPADELARAILGKDCPRVGVCEMPQAGDGAVAAALARQGIGQVHALAPDAQAAEAARKPAAGAGLLGSRVVIETGSPAALPLGDWVADLYLVADATDANLPALSAAEAARVLSPYRGTAVVGNPAGGKAGLSEKALRQWARGTGGNATIREDSGGLWAVVKMPPLVGGDDWGHHVHAADGNLVSSDTAFSGVPLELQWTGKPYYGGHWDIHVVSAGRMFTAQSSVFQHPGGLPYELLARGAYNGQLLWRRPIAEDFGESASLVVATPEQLFLKDGGGVLIVNPETGATIRRIAVTADPSQQCLWLLVSDRILLTLTGPTQKYSHDADDYQPNEAKLRAQGEVNQLYVGRELAAWEVRSGAPLWRFTEAKIDPAKLAVAGRRVYLYANRSYAACLDLDSGRPIWKTPAPIAEPRGAAMGWIDGHATVKNMAIHRQGAVATKEVYLIDYLPHRQYQAFAAADGRLLWDKMHGPTKDLQTTMDVLRDLSGYQVVLGSSIVQRGGRSHDLLTGELLSPGNYFSYGGCGRFSALAGGLLFGQMGEIYDAKTTDPLLQYNAKSSCGTGQFVADGLLFKVGANCPGCSEWRGFFASRSVPRHDRPSGLRLETAAALPAGDTASDPRDWTTYRGDATRKGSSAALVPANATIRWSYAPVHHEQALPGAGAPYLEADVYPPQAVAVGNRIWIGTAEGAVVCLDRSTGGEAWRYWTAGRIMGAPTWWQGRLYAGSCDGWVYCLDAATGSLAWRYRVAPEERRVMIWGQLSSAWPILANVLVEDGTLYAAGGLVGQLGGSVLCALDARTGQPRWEKHFGQGDAPAGDETAADGTSAASALSPSATGQLAWYQGRLWWHVGDSGVIVFDPATGAAHEAIDFAQLDRKSGPRQKHPRGATWWYARGQDLAVLPGGWVVLGGRQFNLPPNCLAQPRNAALFLQATPNGAAPDAGGLPSLLELPALHQTDTLPAWDATEVLLTGRPVGWRTDPLPPILCRGLEKVLDAEVTAHSAAVGDGKRAWNARLYRAAQPSLPAEQQRPALGDSFNLKSRSFLAPILAANAVVFLSGRPGNFQVIAVNRADRSPLWEVKLPEQPVMGELSLTRAGDVLVPLLDGRIVCIGSKRD